MCELFLVPSGFLSYRCLRSLGCIDYLIEFQSGRKAEKKKKKPCPQSKISRLNRIKCLQV